jgi:hypothetical protein
MNKTRHNERPCLERRRLFRLLSSAVAVGVALPLLLPRAQGPRERDLREADFYRPHDLAG